MIPYPGKTLSDLATRMATDLIPHLDTNYAQADGGLIAGLLMTLSQDYERAIHNRMIDIAEIKHICRSSLSNGYTDNQARLEAFLDMEPATLRFSDVEAVHANAFSLLIDIHSWAELHAQTLNNDVWHFLRQHSERNKFEVAGP